MGCLLYPEGRSPFTIDHKSNNHCILVCVHSILRKAFRTPPTYPQDPLLLHSRPHSHYHDFLLIIITSQDPPGSTQHHYAYCFYECSSETKQRVREVGHTRQATVWVWVWVRMSSIVSEAQPRGIRNRRPGRGLMNKGEYIRNDRIKVEIITRCLFRLRKSFLCCPLFCVWILWIFVPISMDLNQNMNEGPLL